MAKSTSINNLPDDVLKLIFIETFSNLDIKENKVKLQLLKDVGTHIAEKHRNRSLVNRKWLQLMQNFDFRKQLGKTISKQLPKNILTLPIYLTKQHNNRTALEIAVQQKEKLSTIQFLVDIIGININKTDEHNRTILHNMIATNNYSYPIIKFLLESKININAKDKNGWTVLYWAIGNNCPIDIIKLLLDKDANMHIKSNRGETSLSLAKKNNKSALTKLLENYQEKHK